MSARWSAVRARLKNRWNDLTEQQRDLWRMGIGVGVLVVVAAAGWGLGRPWWLRWQRTQAVAQAKDFATHRDYRSAALALRRAMQLAPTDPATWREAAQILANIGSPEALVVQQQLARLSPDDIAVKLALAGSALQRDRLDLATATLSEITTAAQGEAAFYRLTAALAMAMGRADETEAALARLVQAAPDDAVARFEYAAVRLWSTDEAKQATAREELRALTAVPKVRVRAALELLKETARQHDERKAIDTMTFLLGRFVPGAVPDFSSAGLPGWQQLVEGLKAAAASDPADVAQVARWLADIGQPRVALVWIDTLPQAVGESPAVADAAAELAAKTGDMDRLEARLQQGAWGVWPREALTLALAARVQKTRYSEANSRATWADALAACGDSTVGLRALVRLAAAWGDDEAIESSLRTVIEREPKALWAYGALRDLYTARPDLPKLAQIYDQWVKQTPDDATVLTPWITLRCVLDRVSAEVRERAESLHAANPSSSAATIALAAVRWREKKPAEAMALLRTLPADNRAESGAALWLGLAAADLGDRATARNALVDAGKSNLPPEAADLVRAAMARLAKTGGS